MRLAERWNHVERGLEPGWTEATLSLEIHDERARSRAAALLGPAGPGLAGTTLRFTVSTRGAGVGPDAVPRLLQRLDDEDIAARLELVGSATAPERPAAARVRLADEWETRLAVLPEDWSDLVVELELESSADIDRAAVLCAPLNPIQTGLPGFRFRCASSRGYGASAGMVGRCLGRLDDDGIAGRVQITRVLSDVHPVGTQGAVFSGGVRPE